MLTSSGWRYAPLLTVIFHGKFRRQSGGRAGLDSASQSFRECRDIVASDTNESYDVWCAEYPHQDPDIRHTPKHPVWILVPQASKSGM